MCTRIVLNTGKEIWNVQDFEDYFGVNAIDFNKNKGLDIWKDCCLCQLDIQPFEAFMNGKRFYHDELIDEWYEE